MGLPFPRKMRTHIAFRYTGDQKYMCEKAGSRIYLGETTVYRSFEFGTAFPLQKEEPIQLSGAPRTKIHV